MYNTGWEHHSQSITIELMKAFFLSYNQALTDRVNRMLDEHGVRGFTRWALTEGRGTYDGEPHYGTHAWPSMNTSILAIVEDEKIPVLLDAVREIDETVNRYKGTEEVSVFHGRDLFAYTAAKLASGIIDFEGVGPEYPVEDIVVVFLQSEGAPGQIVKGTDIIKIHFGEKK